MAKTQRNRSREENVSEYFRNVFKANPQLLQSPTNEDVYNVWLKDHPGYDGVPNRVKQICSYIKGVAKRKLQQTPVQREMLPPAAASEPPSAPTGPSDLELLEASIDDCMMLAKHLDRQGLEHVIHHLRLARNEIVLKQGE